MMSDAIKELNEALKQRDGGTLRPATAADLEQARLFGLPEVLLDFYRGHAPDPSDGRVELNQRIWSVQSAITENRDYVPGTELFPLGYVVFASNRFGDAYCLDTVHLGQSSDLPVVLFPHDVIEEGASLEDVELYRLPVAANLEDFLRKFARGTLIEEPKYA